MAGAGLWSIRNDLIQIKSPRWIRLIVVPTAATSVGSVVVPMVLWPPGKRLLGPFTRAQAQLIPTRNSLQSRAFEDADGGLEGREVQFPSRRVIFREGDLANSLFHVDAGIVTLYRLLPRRPAPGG
jgi:hypothetical protein